MIVIQRFTFLDRHCYKKKNLGDIDRRSVVQDKRSIVNAHQLASASDIVQLLNNSLGRNTRERQKDYGAIGY